MPLERIKDLCSGIILLMLFAMACAAYAYYTNARRAADDSNKRAYHPGAIVLAPITMPLFLVGSIFLFVLKALLYGVFLILFTLALVVFRKPFLFLWLDKI